MEIQTRRFSRLFCPHCKCKVSKSTYYSHYERFYNPRSKEWEQESSKSDGDRDFRFSSDDEEQNTTDTVAHDEDEEEPLVTPSDTDGAESDEVGVQFYVLVCSLNRVCLAGK